MTRTVLLVLGALPLLAMAQNVGLDLDDVPTACRRVCNPIGRLSDQCDVDLRSDIDRDENRLQNQCICTNNSFDVAQVAGLCASCIHQEVNNNRNNDSDDDDDDDNDDDTRDIDQLMSICGFSSTSYNPSVTSQLSSITVSASRPTDISQLTTTLGNAVNTQATTDTVSTTGTARSSSSGPSGTASTTASESASGTATEDDDASATTSTSEPTGAAAHSALPLGGVSGLAATYLIIAGVIGGTAFIF